MRNKLICGCVAVFMLLLATTGVNFAQAEGMEAAGTWYLTGIPAGESMLNPGDLGLEMTLTLGENGTATLETHLDDRLEIHSGTWTWDGAKIQCVMDDREMSLRIQEEELIWGENEGVFRREAAKEAFISELREAFAEDEILGKWALKYFQMGTSMLSAQIMNVQINLEIQPGSIVLSDGVETYDSATEMTGEGLQFIDQYDQQRTLRMTTDGMLYMVGPWDESLSTNMYFERIAE